MADPKLPDLPPLHQLLRLLKSNGFVLGLDDYLRVAEYERWVMSDETLDREAVKAQLGALLCRSDDQQVKFGALFDRYFPETITPMEFSGEPPATPLLKPEETIVEPPTPPLPFRGPEPTPVPAQQTMATGNLGPVLPMLFFPEEHLRLWNTIDMGAALTPLQEKVWTDTSEWDIPGTIRAVVRSGGFPKLVYKKRKQAPRYLALIEQKSSRDHMAGYASELVREINRRDLEADFYFFDNNPAHCWKVQRDVQTHVSIERLRSEWSGARLLLLSHASRFVDPETGVPTNLALDLPHDFSNIALLATNPVVEWGTAERSLASLMPVIPMSVEGLAKLMNLWNGAAPPPTDDWQQLLPEPSAPDVSVRRRKTDPDGFYAELYRYLGEQAFRWLCACAVYPEIYFELTSILHDEAIPQGRHLSEWQRNEQWNQAMRRLSRLAWFRNGHLPEVVAAELKKWLSPHDLAEVEKEIRRILELSKNRVDEDTPAAGLRRDLFNWMSVQNFRVLWIDDNPQNNVGFIETWSKELGILFRTADSNLDAIYKLSNETFDLVISDIGRPSESKPGLATLQMVDKRAPVVFFTNKRGMNLRRTLLEAGAREVTDSVAVLEGVLKEMFNTRFIPQEPVQENTSVWSVDNPEALRLYVSHAREDSEYARSIEELIAQIDWGSGWDVWSETKVAPGENMELARNFALETCNVAVALISPNYLASKWCRLEFERVSERSVQGAIRLFPVGLENCDWNSLPGMAQHKIILSREDRTILRDLKWIVSMRQVVDTIARDLSRGTNVGEAALEENEMEQTAWVEDEWGSVFDQQMKLQALGYYQGVLTGSQDAATREAIRQFQRANGLFADGIMGPQTLKMLKNAKVEFPQEQSQSAPPGPNEHLRNMVREGRVEQALEEMLDLWPDENALILLAARFFAQNRPLQTSQSSIAPPENTFFKEEILTLLDVLEQTPTVRDREATNKLTELKRKSKRSFVYEIQHGINVAMAGLDNKSPRMAELENLSKQLEDLESRKGGYGNQEILDTFRPNVLSAIDAITRADLDDDRESRMKKMK